MSEENLKNYITKLHKKYGKEPFPNNGFYWLKIHRYCKRYHKDWLKRDDYTMPEYFNIYLENTFFKLDDFSERERNALIGLHNKLIEMEKKGNEDVFGKNARKIYSVCNSCEREDCEIPASFRLNNYIQFCDGHPSRAYHHINMNEWFFDYTGKVALFGEDIAGKLRFG